MQANVAECGSFPGAKAFIAHEHGPTTPQADDILDKGVLIVPDVLCRRGDAQLLRLGAGMRGLYP